MKSMQQLFSRENLKTFLIWNVGAFITAVGAYFFKYPNHFSFGGVSGITVVLGHYFPELSLGGINWALNLALLVLGAVMLGKNLRCQHRLCPPCPCPLSSACLRFCSP